MADSNNEIKIKITGEDEASPTLKAAMDKLAAATDRLNQTQVALAGSHDKASQSAKDHQAHTVELAAGFVILKEAGELVINAFEKIAHYVGEAVHAALEAEKAQNQLTGALKSTGQFSEETSQKLSAYVDEMSKVVGVNAEAMKHMIATGIQMGLTAKRATELEEAARKLSAATGKDLQESFSILQGSMAGQARGLARLYPQTKEFTEAQLKQGAAIDFLNKKLQDNYAVYQQSLPASLDRAKAAVDSVYVEFGKIITQNPLAIKAVEFFIEAMELLEEGFKSANVWIKENQATIEKVMAALGKAIAVVVTAVGGFTLLTSAAAGLAAGFAFLISPVGILILAVGALTYAFEKFPYLFDYVEAAGKALFSGLITIAEKFIGAISSVASIFSDDMAKALDQSQAKLKAFSEEMAGSAVKSYDAGEQMRIYGTKAEEAHEKTGRTAADAKKHLDGLHTTVKEIAKSYAGFNIGSEKQREALRAQVQDRDKDLKDFEEYLNAKSRLAISKAQEQQLQLDAFKAKALKGGGSTGVEAEKQVEVDTEVKKQAELQSLRDKRVIDEEQFEASMLASKQRAAQARLEMDLANEQARADLLGESEQGYQAKQALAEDRYQLELQAKLERAQNEMATDEEIQAMRDEAQSAHDQQMIDMQDAHLNAIAAREEISGATVTATRNKWFREQEKAQASAIKNFASGVMLMESIQSAMNQTFQKLGDALIKNQQITASKMVGVFLEMLGRQVQQKGFADLVMGIFPPNPVQLGVGAAEIAAGTAIGRLGVSMQGGQADEGMDEIPQPLSGKSFVMSGGERIVQPSANRDLKDFLSKEKQGGGSGQVIVNITVQAGSSQEAAKETVDAFIDEIRRRSELGTPIISQKGVTPA